LFIAGEEYIDEWKNPRTGVVTYYCSLCGCQFDSKLIVTHAKGQGHRQQYRVCFGSQLASLHFETIRTPVYLKLAQQR